MKPVVFCGNSLQSLKQFPIAARREAGHQIDRVQHGLNPLDWKPMPSIGVSVREIRIRAGGNFRVIYLATRDTAIYVLHAFHKKSQKTRSQDIMVSRKAFHEFDK